ncbi:MAG: sensor histidine kinase [Runella slithyformis]|nr:MAG: sensor histidine kinase [Runella slithyformis]TAF27212.1 MAG: sensor histidine kinase [Runella slithyformis]TAF45860.1 MAG: sensor histidine kinase [Runella slithyformis]TAF80687.1 MAG: sensor histidine kinase [Runella slithyformis]
MTDIGLLAVVATFTFLLLASFIMGFFFLFQRRQQQNLQEKQLMWATFQQELLQSQLEIQSQTLQRVGEELHDNIGQLLSLARFQLNILEEQPTTTTSQIHEVNETMRQAIDELRALSKSLDGGFVQDFGLADSLAHELRRIRQTGKCQAQFRTQGEPYRLNAQKEMVLFRVAQELLNNVLKHAGASVLIVELQYTPAALRLSIEDNGQGFDYEAVISRKPTESGSGLRNIRRRTELIGGSYTLTTAAGRGTTAVVEVKNTV